MGRVRVLGSWRPCSQSFALMGKFTLDFADDTSLPIAMIATQNMQTQLQRQYPLKCPLYRNDSLSTFLFPDCILQVVQLNIWFCPSWCRHSLNCLICLEANERGNKLWRFDVDGKNSAIFRFNKYPPAQVPVGPYHLLNLNSNSCCLGNKSRLVADNACQADFTMACPPFSRTNPCAKSSYSIYYLQYFCRSWISSADIASSQCQVQPSWCCTNQACLQPH